MRAKSILIIAVVTALLLFGLLTGCGGNEATPPPNETGGGTPTTTTPAWELDLPANLDIEGYRGLYPRQVETFLDTSHGRPSEDYLVVYPFLTNVYEGSSFAKGWDSPRPHPEALGHAKATPRNTDATPPGCYSCKSAQYWTATGQLADDIKTKTFRELEAEITIGISCYDCHMNRPGRDTRDGGSGYVGASRPPFVEYFPKTLPGDAACGQCHSEHRIDPDDNTKVYMPDLIDPVQLYEFYTSIGYSDFTNPRTGTDHLKAQHPEFQTCAVGTHASRSVTCARCHMEQVTDEKGSYTVHYLTSPTKSSTIIKDVCLSCHLQMTEADVVAMVEGLQAHYRQRRVAVGERLAAFNDRFASAIEDGSLTDTQLAEIRALNREAQWYWDWMFTENSDGVHNPVQSRQCLDKAEALIDKGEGMLP